MNSKNNNLLLPPNPYAMDCPSRKLLDLIGSKWALLILPIMIEGPKRNSELMKQIEGISQKMLTQTLKLLVEANILHRKDYGEIPPRVDYALTKLGESLVKVVAQLDQWVIDNYDELTHSQD